MNEMNILDLIQDAERLAVANSANLERRLSEALTANAESPIKPDAEDISAWDCFKMGASTMAGALTALAGFAAILIHVI